MSLKNLKIAPHCPIRRLWNDRLDYEYDFFVEPNVISVARKKLLTSTFETRWLKEECPPEISDIQCCMGPFLSDADLLGPFTLVRHEMKKLFDKTGFEGGWSDHRVFGRLRDRHMMYIILYSNEVSEVYGSVVSNGRTLASRAIAAFAAFKVEINEDLDEPRAWIMELHVAKPFQRRGIATTLIRYIASLCVIIGIDRLELCAMLENTAALNLYMKRLGFKVIEEFEDCKILELPLRPWPLKGDGPLPENALFKDVFYVGFTQRT